MVTTLETRDLSLGYGQRHVVKNVSLSFPPGKLTAIIGPNGCGKSTLLKGLGRVLAPFHGQVLLNGKDIRAYAPGSVAKLLSVLPQSPQAPEEISVKDLVMRGRHPHRAWWQRPSLEDHRVVDDALAKTQLADVSSRDVARLSGGQQQRAWIAMALAQEADIILLDEPTSHLDVKYQLDILHLLAELTVEGRTAIVVLHDLQLAARYAHYCIVMKSGQVLAEGETGDVLKPSVLRDGFEIDAEILPGREAEPTVIVPYRLQQ